MSKVTVLGAGMVGSAIARDLAARHTVRSADRSEGALEELRRRGIETHVVDLADPAVVARTAEGSDLVVCAVPGFLGFQTLRTLIEHGHDVVDIAFASEDVLALDGLARERGATVVVDMGVAPGMHNVILGHHDAQMKVERFQCLVGGLPQARTFPYAYKAPFSPIDVIEEYTRPVRAMEGGQVVVRPALSNPELVEFDQVGTLEAFETDGLRSLLTTMAHVPEMSEKTMRYPGHRDRMVELRAAGFFGTEPIAVGDQTIRPIDATSAILLAAWRLGPDEPEQTLMRVTVEGTDDQGPVRHVYDLHDRFDPTTRTSSMARTTGYACTAVAQLLLDRTWHQPGVTPPELLGRAGHLPAILAYQADRGIAYRARRERPEAPENRR